MFHDNNLMTEKKAVFGWSRCHFMSTNFFNIASKNEFS